MSNIQAEIGDTWIEQKSDGENLSVKKLPKTSLEEGQNSGGISKVLRRTIADLQGWFGNLLGSAKVEDSVSLEKQKKVRFLMAKVKARLVEIGKIHREIKGIDSISESYSIFWELYCFAEEKLPQNEEFWRAFTSYLEQLGYEDQKILRDSVWIDWTFGFFGGEQEVERALFMGIFANSKVVEIILKSEKLRAEENKQKRHWLVINMLRLDEELVQRAMDYFEALPNEYLQTELQVKALAEFCKSNEKNLRSNDTASASESLRQADLALVREFMAKFQDKAGKSPYR